MNLFISKAFAATKTSGTTVDSLLDKVIENIANPLIFFLFALAVVYFLYGVMIFIQNADSPDRRSEGFQHMIWGVIGIFIMVSSYGIINLIKVTLGV